jgi:hypothetical protein
VIGRTVTVYRKKRDADEGRGLEDREG